MPCDFTGGRTEWDEPITTDACSALDGCDLVLACFPDVVDEAIAAVAGHPSGHSERLLPLRGAIGASWDSLTDNPQRDRFVARITALDAARGNA